VRHVLFHVGKDQYALPLDAVREVIIAPRHYTRVPRASAEVKGVMTLRGRVVPVVDLAKLLKVDEPPATPGKIVLLELGRRDLGLLVSEVDGIEAIEMVERVASQTSTLVRGLTRVGDQPASVLDVQGLDAAVAASFGNG
jgi:purine-binding chemotaxis protein CheW